MINKNNIYINISKKSVAFRITLGAMFAALGVIFPQIFHFVSGAALGRVLLPMHIPVLISGLLLGPAYGAAVGVISPVLSCLITGMPAAAYLPFMACELFGYGLVSGALCRFSPFKYEILNLYLRMIAAMISGRVVLAAALWAGGNLFRVNVGMFPSVLAAVYSGIPGIILQLAVVPALTLMTGRVILHVKKN